MIVANIERESTQLCHNIGIAAKTFLDTFKKNQSKIIVLQSLKPQIIGSILFNRLSQYDLIINNYQIIPLNNLTSEDLQKNN